MVTRSRMKRSGAGAKKKSRLKHLKSEIPAREKIIEPYVKPSFHKTGEEWDIRYYDNMPIEVVEKLMKKKFLNPKDSQNWSPNAGKMLKFMKKMKELGFDVRAHGYETSATRDDVRVTIEGVMTVNRDTIDNPTFRKEWTKFNAEADEFDMQRSWWD